MVIVATFLRQFLELFLIIFTVPGIQNTGQISKKDVKRPLGFCWDFRLVRSVTLPFTLQLLLQSRKKFLEVLEHCRIIDIDFPVRMFYDPGLDVAPMK